MYGKHVILIDTLTAEAHDALVVGEQAAEVGGPKELLTLAYVRKDAPAAAMHENRVLYRAAVRPADHLDVKAGKVLHFYKVPEPAVPVLYALFLDSVQREEPEEGGVKIGVLVDGDHTPKKLRDVVKGDVLAVGPFPMGSTVKSVIVSDDGSMVNILAESNPKPVLAAPAADDDAGDPPQGGVAALEAQTAADAANQGPAAATDEAPTTEAPTTDEQAAPAELETAQAAS